MAMDPTIEALMSEEELAAINDGLDEDEVDALTAIAGEDDSDGDSDDADEEGQDSGDDDGADDGSDADGGAGEDSDDAEGGDSESAEQEEPEPPAATSRRAYRASLPDSFADDVAAVEAHADALADSFKAGDLDFDEYRAEMSKLDTQRDALAAVKLKAEISAEMEQQSAEQQWQDAINALVKRAVVEDKIDYGKDADKQQDLDTFVKVLAANRANANKPMDWFLAEAHKRVKALHGIQTAAPVPIVPGGKPAARRPNLSALPKTLAHVPGGDGPGDVGDEFATIDALDGIELEDALARMTPAQREKYARG